ncbi:MAG TPA: SPOR domain-containing protein [Caulobacteraceae bacterium]|nr:SPOR domain-containing protein [Caulobacteraceae bacterium]
MSDYDRGPERPERPLAFDPRRPVRGAGPVPLTLIVSAVVLLGLIGAAAYIYRGGIGRAKAPPVEVGAPLGDFKSPAPPGAAANDATAGLVIYRTGAPPPQASNAASPVFAPPPEQPQPRPVEAAGAPPPPPPPPAVAVHAASQPSALGALADAVANRPASEGAGWAQIGAFSSPALARKGWTAIARFAPAAMAGRGEKVEPVKKGGATFYRTYITGFESGAAAQRFCERLRAASRPCLVK